MTDTQMLLTVILGLCVTLAAIAVIFNVDDMFGIPIVSSMLFGCAAGCGFALFFQNLVWVACIVGVISAVGFSWIINKIKRNLQSPDMNDYFS